MPSPTYVDSDKRYRVLNELGAGAFARVYLCRDRVSRQIRAVKVANRSGDESLLREARGLKYVNHPGVVRVHDVGEDERGRPYLVMDFIEGPTLRDFLSFHRRLPLAVAVDLAREIGRSLEAIHAEGIVHRDLTPANVILDRRTHRPVVCDFGIARDLGLSTQGSGQGTLAYMSPEQMRGRATVRSDVFSLGVLLFEMLTGTVPWGEARTAIIAYRILRLNRRGLARRMSAIPEGLRPLLLGAMARDPRARYPSMSALLRALDEVAVRRRGRTLEELLDAYYNVRRVCSHCGADLITHMRFCPECADRKALSWTDQFPGRCGQCGWERAAGWSYCAWCGAEATRRGGNRSSSARGRGYCPSCRGRVPLYARFCTHCKERLSWDVEFKIPCPSCGWGVSDRWRGCPWCGRRLSRRRRTRKPTAARAGA